MNLNKQTLKKWTKEIISTSILIFIIANAISFYKSPNLQDKNLPSFNTELTNNNLFSTKQNQGKPLLIHFWATWCPTCKLEAGNIEFLSKHFNVLTIAVKSGSNKEINEYLKERDLNFKVINDENGLYSQQFLVPAFPTTFIYDKDAKLSFTEVGYTSTWGLYLRMWLAS